MNPPLAYFFLDCRKIQILTFLRTHVFPHAGSIDGNELGNALRSFGYGLSPRLLHILTQKYSEYDRVTALARFLMTLPKETCFR